jgi:phosphatidylinositol-3,4,5-trisphosphate 3-phosphatase and dual-specificity protein phosphatase PTEN
MREEDFDLDLTYITPRVIAMGLPSFGIEGKYRNPAPEVRSFFHNLVNGGLLSSMPWPQVRRFLESRHKDKYMVFNLSERLYDPSLFEYRVLDMGFPDHYAPPLEVAWALCRSMDGWLSADPQNVVAVHCKAGKAGSRCSLARNPLECVCMFAMQGRTGVGICCYLIFSGMFLLRQDGTPVGDHLEMARLCMDYFQTTRGEGINYTSQERTVQYFSKVGRWSSGLDRLPVCPDPRDVPCDLLQVVFDAYQQGIAAGGDPLSLASVRAVCVCVCFQLSLDRWRFVWS